MVISYSLRGFEVFLNAPAIIIMIFGKNNVLGTMYIDLYIYIYISISVASWRGGLHGSPYILFLLFMKSEKVQELKSNSTLFSLKIFFPMTKKKNGTQRAPLPSF